ncbi:30S ribosomal protein S9 [Patescibacteria group bacterium]|nr:30S ribosomal protein S9 [Patescibacteria group bacterium]
MPEKKKVKPKAKIAIKKVLAKTIKKSVVKKVSDSEKDESKRYFEAIGRRKRATARVRLFTCKPFEDEKGKITINGKPYTEYFPTIELQYTIINPLKKMKSLNRFEVTVKVEGGGIKGQAEAVRHSLSRALVKFNPDFSKKLKRSGYLRRDPRRKERKKPGLKKARKASQWKKR